MPPSSATTTATPLTLSIRMDVQYTVTDRWLLLASAQDLALQHGTTLPVDIPGAVRALLTLADTTGLQTHPEDVGLAQAAGALTATMHPASPAGVDPGGGTVVLELRKHDPPGPPRGALRAVPPRAQPGPDGGTKPRPT